MVKYILLLVATIFSLGALCQQGSFSYMDPAQMINKLLIETNSQHYRIGNYDVVGLPYLYGDNVNGQIFGKSIGAAESIVKYNVYTQNLEFIQDGKVQEVADVIDSFRLNPKDVQSIMFVSGASVWETSGHAFYQELYIGKTYSLYKKYTMELELVSTNYVQSNLKQFSLQYQYYYTNNFTKELRKIKPSVKAITNEFKTDNGLKEYLKANETSNEQLQLVNAFTFLNKEK